VKGCPEGLEWILKIERHRISTSLTQLAGSRGDGVRLLVYLFEYCMLHVSPSVSHRLQRHFPTDGLVEWVRKVELKSQRLYILY
jgi:hypothetical protein